MRFPNLHAEISRIGKNKKDLAPLLNIRVATVYDKLNGKAPISWEEIIKIREEWFPGLSIDYLMDEGGEQFATITQRRYYSANP